MTSLTRPAHEASNHRHPPNSPALRRCRFVKISDVSGLPFDILHRFGGGRQTVFGLEEVPLDSPEASAPADTWVTLPGCSPNAAPEWQLRRSDAQFLARRLLGLSWSAEGYLFGRHRATRLWRFLSAAAAELPGLLERARQHVELLGEGEADRARLRDVLDHALPASDRQLLDRAGTAALVAALAAFDVRLARAKPESVVAELVGVLVLTDAEFRALVAQSSRHLGAATAAASSTAAADASASPVAGGNVVTFDRRASAVLVPSAFGVRQAFAVDLERLYHANGTTQKFFREEGRNVIEAGLRVVILAALRACCVMNKYSV
ncbi:hypothetical protein UCRNP2_5903 [Neofusicoccum parvum UCRNP2]|uniref:Uncharacterized protein n=2 Tax=Neofusicoccum parvum TaxID=310453 RepID=R1GMV4_BOTPV|nr:hypothetical protein UCRNP2_5903 [Neofusicoccum parvum UCRNP2]GME48734.1 hypothetical protein GTA08_BOTSDO00486 [Neofusicoccum parvum]